MPVNPYFQNGLGFGSNVEQEMLRTLIDESIKIKGIDVYYIPRKVNNLDNILGEDKLSSFEHAIPIEMYFESVDRYSGMGDFVTQFGLTIDDSMVFKVSRNRWQELVGQYGWCITPRPAEGDLILTPFENNSLLEIKYVGDTDPFFTHNTYYTYKLVCTTFQYSHEQFVTDVDEVNNPIDGTNGGNDSDPGAFNNTFNNESPTVFDTSETNAFGF